MSSRFWLSEEQVERLRPHFPKAWGKPRVADRRVLSGMLHVLRSGLRWQDAPAVYGPPKTFYNRFARWSRLGVFAPIVRGLARPGPARPGRRHPHDGRHAPEGSPHGGRSRDEGGAATGDRAHEGRPELRAPHGQRRQRPTADLCPVPRPDERRPGRPYPRGAAPTREAPARGQGPSSLCPPPVREQWRGPTGCGRS
jgi:transposase